MVLMAVLAAAGHRKSTVFFKQFDHFASTDGSDIGETLVSDKKAPSCVCKGSLSGQDPKLILLLFGELQSLLYPLKYMKLKK